MIESSTNNEFFIYYDKTTGIVCDRYPTDVPRTPDSGVLIINDFNLYNATFGAEGGKCWKVIDDTLVVGDIDGYKETHKAELLRDEQSSILHYLDSTDFVIMKIEEARIIGEEELATTVAKYADILNERKQKRARFNKIDEELKELE